MGRGRGGPRAGVLTRGTAHQSTRSFIRSITWRYVAAHACCACYVAVNAVCSAWVRPFRRAVSSTCNKCLCDNHAPDKLGT